MLGQRRRRSQTEEGSDESEEERYGTPSERVDSPKRQKLDAASDSEASISSAGNGRPLVNGNGTKNNNVAIHQPTSEDFQPGAIVRVSVTNFVTYEKAEFLPGPNLNMVIGPNGTGKSSLVCAICLGLGYSPKHLGRAGSVKEFVKHGKDIATIEIELKRKPSDRLNYTIRVQIRREQNSQKWWLNGKETTHKAIQKLMRSLHIQVDNLCQFLPQDRVVEFAACTPIDLLQETLRAAASENMLQWQSQLRDLHKDKKELTEASRTDVEALKHMENRQQGLQADVDRVREREEIQGRVEDLRHALVMARYQDVRGRHAKAREQRVQAQASLKRLEEESGPSLEAVNSKQTYAQNIHSALAVRERTLAEATSVTEQVARDVKDASDKIEAFESRVSSERTAFDKKRKDISLSRQKITSLQADLKNQPPEFNAGSWNQKIRAEEHDQRDLAAELRQVNGNIDEVRTRGAAHGKIVEDLKMEIANLDTQQGQQVNLLRRQFPEVATAWDWIQEHKDIFEKEVFGPPLVSCSMKDDRYGDQVQSLLQLDDYTCITAQTKNDYKKLTQQLYRVMSLSVVVRTCPQPLQAYLAPIDAQAAASLGLDGFAIDFLNGPEPVLAMLCAEKRLHQSGISLREHGDAEYERLVNSGTVSQWAAGKQSFIVRRRKEYGPNAMSAITKHIQPGRFWTSQPVDAQEKAEVKRKLIQLKGERDVMKEEHAQLKKNQSAIVEKQAEKTDEIARLKDEKSTLQREFQKWQSLPEKIESEERQKAGFEEDVASLRQGIVDIQYEWDEAVLSRAQMVLQYKATVDKLRDARLVVLDAKLRYIEATSDVKGLKDRNASIMTKLDDEKKNVQVALTEVNRLRDLGRQVQEQLQQLLSVNEGKQEVWTELIKDKTADDVQMEIDAEEAKLELIHAANPNVIREFDKRALEIAKLSKKMESFNEKLDGLQEQLDALMGKFEPKLNELVSKINDAFAYNFEQISCAGEVRVHRDDDFDLWALDIMVRFRENETLQQLTAHRQSGGERAVSTIFYLMALQSMAQSPFRVVDEINQGMDPRNERMVHERMVEIACREHTSQYFLITPKLLSGLRYDPKMRVLCIASGEHMPREGQKLDFGRCLKIQKGLMAAG